MNIQSRSSILFGPGSCCLALLLLPLVSLSACTPAPPPAPTPVEEPVEQEVLFTHTVRYAGETLGLIARWYTGKTTNWEQILEANPGLRPERINLRDEILIPESMMTRKDPLPEAFVRQAMGAVKSSPGNTEGAGAVTEEISDDGLFDDVSEEEEPSEEASSSEDDKTVEGSGAASAADDALVDELLNELAQDEEPAKAEAPTGASEPESGGEADAGVPSAAERERLLDELLGE